MRRRLWRVDDAGGFGVIDTLTVDKARDLAEAGYKRLEPARQQGKAALEAYTGSHYMQSPPSTVIGDDNKQANTTRRPANLTAQQIRTLLVALAYSAGKAECTAKFANLEWDAELRAASLDQDTEKLNLVEKNQDVLVETICYGLGITRVGLKAGSRVYSDGTAELDPGELYEEPVSFDDFTIDPFARKFSEARFKGFRFRASRRDMIENKLYGRDPEDYEPGETPINPNIATRDEAAVILQNLPKLKQQNPGGDTASELSQPGTGQAMDDDDLVEMWELEFKWRGEVWTVVLPANQGTRNVMGTASKFLLIEKSPLPEEGTLEFLSFLPVPNNIMPLGLESLQKDLATVADLLCNKLIRQALRLKSNTIYDPSAEDEMLYLKSAEDGEFVKGDPSKFTQVTQAGQTKDIAEANAFFMELWNNSTGNLQLKAGQNDPTDTATAFQGMMGQVQGWMQYLTNRYEGFGSRCMRKRAWFLEHDPLMDKVLPYRVDDTWTIPVRYTAAEKQGKYLDFNYRIRSGSTRFMDPILEGQQLIQLFTQALPALMQLIQAGAYKPGALRAMHRKFNVTDMDQFLTDPQLMQERMMLQQMGPQASKGQAAGQPPQQPGTQPGPGPPGGQPPGAPPMMPGPQQGPSPMQSRTIDAGRSAAMQGA